MGIWSEPRYLPLQRDSLRSAVRAPEFRVPLPTFQSRDVGEQQSHERNPATSHKAKGIHSIITYLATDFSLLTVGKLANFPGKID